MTSDKEGTPIMSSTKAPVVFIHGLWLHASSWGPWQDLFATAGYESSAPGWPGEADSVEDARNTPDNVADHGIDDVTQHYASYIDSLPARPILIGHSFGGMIAEKLLGLDYAVAAIGIDAAQIKGVLPLPLSALRSTLPVFKNPANRHRAVSLTAEEFRYSFGNAVSPEESDQLHQQWAVPSPAKPLFEAATANFTLHSPDAVNTKNPDRPGGVRPRPLTGHRLRLAYGGRGLPGLAQQVRSVEPAEVSSTRLMTRARSDGVSMSSGRPVPVQSTVVTRSGWARRNGRAPASPVVVASTSAQCSRAISTGLRGRPS